MIQFINNSLEKPFKIFFEKYNKAIVKQQTFIEAMSISSYDINKKEVNSRFVNVKYLDNNKFIFFTNYNSPKSIEFDSHKQSSVLFFWEKINIQIRMKGNIYKTSTDFNQKHFLTRSPEKNALAISSDQSSKAESYKNIISKYHSAKESNDLLICPKHWGGFSFVPYEIEFWEGNKYRINKRDLYSKEGNNWNHSILEP